MKEKIYLIPGLMTDERLWSRITPHLEKNYDLIHLPIPLSENFDDVINQIDKNIKEDNINLLGFSLGGYIASYYAVNFPKKVNKLFLLSSTPSETEEKDILRREKKLHSARSGDFTPLNEKKALDLSEIKNDEELLKIVCDMFNDLGNEVFVPQLSLTLKRKNLFKPLRELQIPVHLFYSLGDRLLNHTSIDELKHLDHDFEFFAREGSSHNISLEFPETLSERIRKWMETS
eukprot:gnl/Chilomastix_cuspidata/8024.p1 GENE.gnl/Chilomastix_cuspidata/8024~~gnl/Chilomastix_cuspidata/8024.p1  ORF type:complete len:232 (-),score=13.41 gnl/Chilomastix_cuspidata/8024:329-1024(-)